MPLISAVIVFLFIFIPRIDPLKKNIGQFRKHFDMFMVLLVPGLLFWFVLVPVIFSALYAVIYSYVLYSRERR